MQITPETRAELERRGWVLMWDKGSVQQWHCLDEENESYGDLWIHSEGIHNEGSLLHAMKFAAILGISPPGYRLVPESVAQEWLDSQDAFSDKSKGRWEHNLRYNKATRALASALQPTNEIDRLKRLRAFIEAEKNKRAQPTEPEEERYACKHTCTCGHMWWSMSHVTDCLCGKKSTDSGGKRERLATEPKETCPYTQIPEEEDAE